MALHFRKQTKMGMKVNGTFPIVVSDYFYQYSVFYMLLRIFFFFFLAVVCSRIIINLYTLVYTGRIVLISNHQPSFQDFPDSG